MPQLITSVVGNVYTNTTGSVMYVNSVVGTIQQEDYIDLNGFIAYLQNLSKAEDTSGLVNPDNFGLKNSKNLEVKEIKIDY